MTAVKEFLEQGRQKRVKEEKEKSEIAKELAAITRVRGNKNLFIFF
jgi:hypothetical protein